MSNKPLKMSGPWKGMDLRENGDSANTYFLGMNVDTSNGLIEARQPMLSVAAAPFRANLHVVDRPGLPKVVLAVGTSTTAAGGSITFQAFDADSTTALAAAQDLTAAFGEPPDVTSTFRCSFVDTWLNPTDANNTLRPVTLVVTPTTTYAWEPAVSQTTLHTVDVTTDSFQINGVNFAYWLSIPRGPITCTHQSKVYYAGFPVGMTVLLDSPLEDLQNDVPEAFVAGTTRTALALSPSTLVWSDEVDPLAVSSRHQLQIDPREKITALHSLGEALLVFSDRSVYLLAGSDDDSYSINKVQGGVGCVGAKTVVQVGTDVYFMGHDGIYAFGGLAAPMTIKLSGGLDPLWLGWSGTQTHLPDALREQLLVYGWPWEVISSECFKSNAVHVPRYNQIWWSLPTTGVWNPNSFPLTLVYDVDARGFNIYCQSITGGTNGYKRSCMYDGVTLDHGMRLITSNGMGYLQEYGAGGLSDTIPGNLWNRGVPMMWLSSRLYGEEITKRQAQVIWFKLLGTGVVTTDQYAGVIGTPPPPVTVGSDLVPVDIPMYFCEGEETLSDQDDLGFLNDYEEKRGTTAALSCYPNPGTTSLFGTGLFGTATFAPTGWFTSRGSVMISSKSFRVGIIDNPLSRTNRGNNVHMSALQIDVAPGGSRT